MLVAFWAYSISDPVCLMSIADLILKNMVSFKFTKQGGISGSQTFSYYVFEIIAYYDQHEFGRNQWKDFILHLTA